MASSILYTVGETKLREDVANVSAAAATAGNLPAPISH